MKPMWMILGVFAFANALAQTNYGVHPMLLSDYAATIKGKPGKALVRLDKQVPGIVLDIRYATTNNFTGAKVYRLARAYTRVAVARALKSAQEDFNKLGYGIK